MSKTDHEIHEIYEFFFFSFSFFWGGGQFILTMYNKNESIDGSCFYSEVNKNIWKTWPDEMRNLRWISFIISHDIEKKMKAYFFSNSEPNFVQKMENGYK